MPDFVFISRKKLGAGHRLRPPRVFRDSLAPPNYHSTSTDKKTRVLECWREIVALSLHLRPSQNGRELHIIHFAPVLKSTHGQRIRGGVKELGSSQKDRYRHFVVLSFMASSGHTENSTWKTSLRNKKHFCGGGLGICFPADVS